MLATMGITKLTDCGCVCLVVYRKAKMVRCEVYIIALACLDVTLLQLLNCSIFFWFLCLIYAFLE